MIVDNGISRGSFLYRSVITKTVSFFIRPGKQYGYINWRCFREGPMVRRASVSSGEMGVNDALEMRRSFPPSYISHFPCAANRKTCAWYRTT